MTMNSTSTLTCVSRPKLQSFRAVLVAWGMAVAAGAVGIGVAPAPGAETTVLGQNDPVVDFDAVQHAVDHFDVVNLKGTFNFTDMIVTRGPLMITHDVIIRGEEPTGNFSPDKDNWVDERVWPTEIVVNNVYPGTTMEIDNPGGRVELANLSVESGSEHVILIGDGSLSAAPRAACMDLRINNSKILGIHEHARCVVTWGGLTGILHLADNHIVGRSCAVDEAFWEGLPSRCRWEVCSNTLVAAYSCLDTAASEGIIIENNRCEGPYILFSPATRGEIVVRDNMMIQSGHHVSQTNHAAGMSVSHEQGFHGGEITGNTIDMNPTEDVGLDITPAICLATYGAIRLAAHGLLVQDNTITGKADCGIILDNGASDNVIRRNNLENFTAHQFGPFGAAQIALDEGHNNLFTRNVIGPLGSGAFTGILCRGTDNDIIRNDYTHSSIGGLTSGDQPCVILDKASKGNLVFESEGLPPGTGDATEQVLDIPREPSESTRGSGKTDNIAVGHSADVLARDINPGIGTRLTRALAVLD